MKQLSFEWAEEPELDERVEIELLPAVSESVLAAMVLILICLVRPSEEKSDER